jgi:hypothetical protein
MRSHSRVKHFYICLNGENLWKTFQETNNSKQDQIYLQSDLMQNQVVRVMVSERLGPQWRKVILHVFIWEILTNMTQVSDMAHVPFVSNNDDPLFIDSNIE